MSKGNKCNTPAAGMAYYCCANVALLSQATENCALDVLMPDKVARTILKRVSCWRHGKESKLRADVNKTVQLSHRNGAAQGQLLMQREVT